MPNFELLISWGASFRGTSKCWTSAFFCLWDKVAATAGFPPLRFRFVPLSIFSDGALVSFLLMCANRLSCSFSLPPSSFLLIGRFYRCLWGLNDLRSIRKWWDARYVYRLSMCVPNKGKFTPHIVYPLLDSPINKMRRSTHPRRTSHFLVVLDRLNWKKQSNKTNIIYLRLTLNL